jgi:hypothetical protein
MAVPVAPLSLEDFEQKKTLSSVVADSGKVIEEKTTFKKQEKKEVEGEYTPYQGDIKLLENIVPGFVMKVFPNVERFFEEKYFVGRQTGSQVFF